MFATFNAKTMERAEILYNYNPASQVRGLFSRGRIEKNYIISLFLWKCFSIETKECEVADKN